ncbi:DUF3552 domain-containing protein, partial [Candidatus Peregrinibacteria bacterium]|nr:DUF3552 domain-containing protein [Candidatus Peregrinibacteria bacterium]
MYLIKMNTIIINLAIITGGIAVGVISTAFIFRKKKFIDVEKKEQECKKMIEKSKTEAKQIIEDTKAQAEKIKERLKEEIEKREERIKKIKKSLKHKEENLNKREERTKELKLKIASYKEEIQSKQNAIGRIEKEIIEKLSAKTSKSTEELRENLLRKYKTELEEEGAKKLADQEESLKENASKIAGKIVVNTMQRLCSPTSVETRAVLIKVPKDHIKGKIVGRNGENIKAFEEQLDVAVVFNDLPNTISVSAFNLVTRRIAEKAIEKLIKRRGGIN